MNKLLSLLGFCIFAGYCASQNIPNIQSEDSKLICCVCVPFYACYNGRMNMTILSTVPESRKELTSNVKKCPHHQDYCCNTLIDDSRKECQSLGEVPPVVSNKLRPNTNCDCILYQLCPLESIISDDRFVTSEFLYRIGLLGHSKCDEQEVCCNREVPMVHGRPRISDTAESCICVMKDKCEEDAYVYGDGLLTPRLGNSSRDKPCGGDKVCCPKSALIEHNGSTSICSNLFISIIGSISIAYLLVE